jgi:acyl-CoA thioesterase YciA
MSSNAAGSALALRTVAMPAFTNSHGDIFGGWLLSQMDLAGGAVATRLAEGRVVTVAVTEMSFQLPVFVGDEVTCYATVAPRWSSKSMPSSAARAPERISR